MQAVILSGGLGTRLRPLTDRVPKPMVPVSGRPFLEHQLKLLKNNGISKIVLCVGYKWESIRRYFGNGSKFGLSIAYSIDKNLLGTGGALRKAGGLLEDNFFLLNGDTFLPVDYRKMADDFIAKGKVGLIAISRNTIKSKTGNVNIGRGGILTGYQKSCRDIKYPYLDAGAGVYCREVMDFFPAGKKFSFEEVVYPQLINKKELFGFLFEGRFYDIGTYERLKIFEERIKDDNFPYAT